VHTKVRLKGNPWHTIAYRGVPMFRAQAAVLLVAYEQGAPHTIASADRRDSVVNRFNKNHGTHLHGQDFLIHMHEVDPAHWFPANPKDETSHCLRSDGNKAYRWNGKQIPKKGKLPKVMLGIDAQDQGPHARANDCSHLVHVINACGFSAVQPYLVGTEMHHFILNKDPVPRLRELGVL
jgi:hypothetical protein